MSVAPPHIDEQASGARHYGPHWLVPAIVGAAVLMQTLSATVVLNALPSMARDFHVGAVSVNGAITMYLLGAAIFLPLTGWLAEQWGARRVFLLAICLYAVSSALVGMAQHLDVLLTARFVQGAASSAVLPVGRLILMRSRRREDFTAALAIVSMAALIGPFLGPVIGGFLVTFASWRIIFFLNLPIAALGMFLAYRYLPLISRSIRPFDARGFLLLGSGFAALVFGFQALGRDSANSLGYAGLFVAGAVALILYGLHARHKYDLVIDPRIFRHPICSAAILGGSFFRIGTAAFPFLLTINLQVSLGASPLATGATMGAIGLGAIATKLWVVPVLVRHGFRKITLISLVAAAMLLVAAPYVARTQPLMVLAVLLTASGIAQSTVMTCINSLVYADIETTEMAAASTATGMIQQFSQSVGVGVAAALISHAADVGSTVPFAIFGGAMLLSALWFLRLPAGAGSGLLNTRSQDGDVPQ